jgi:hypothetical protein
MDGSVAHCAGGVSATETISWSAPVISDGENANSYPPMCHGAVGGTGPDFVHEEYGKYLPLARPATVFRIVFAIHLFHTSFC